MPIAKMKRLQVLALERDHDALLRQLERMGCVEISEPDAPDAPESLRRCDSETADCLANHIAKEYAAYHRIEIELVHEMFCVVIFGLVGLAKMNPQIEDDVLMKVIEQTLRLDMVPIGKGEG